MKARSSQAQELLMKLRSLYALWRIDNDPSFTRHHYFPSYLQDKIHEDTNALCADLAQHIRCLVDGFAIPDHLLGTIAGDWEAANSFDRSGEED